MTEPAGETRGTNTLLNSGQNTVLLAKLCRKTKSVLIGAQTILSITVKFHARRMRGAKSVQTIGFLHKLVGGHSVHPSKRPPTAIPTATHHTKQILEKSNTDLIFLSFEDTTSAVTLACKDDIGASKPIKHPCFIENLCKICSNQATVLPRFFKSGSPSGLSGPNPLTFSSAQSECEHSAKPLIFHFALNPPQAPFYQGRRGRI